MKRIIQDHLAKRLPANTNFLKYVDKETHDNLINLCIGLFGDNAKVILSGCQLSGITGGIAQFSPGVVFVSNELFYVDGLTMPTEQEEGEARLGFIIKSTVESETFKDGITYPAYMENKLILTFSSYVLPENDYTCFKRFENKTINFIPTAITGVLVSQATQIIAPNTTTIIYSASFNMQSVDPQKIYAFNIPKKVTNGEKYLGTALFQTGTHSAIIPAYLSANNYIFFRIVETAGVAQAKFTDIFSRVFGSSSPQSGIMTVDFSVTVDNNEIF